MAKQLLNEFADISALKKQQQQVVGVLDDVTKKLKEMQAMGLSFSRGAKDIETTKDGTRAIDEQAKAMARLETEQKKLVQAQAELYKTEQQAIQVRKEAERQAKLQAQATNEQIGAYKRLEAEAALATAKFKDLAAQFGVESAEAKKAGIEAGALNQRLKDVDATVGQNQRNVGNYTQTTVSLRTEIRNLTQTLAQMSMAGKENTKEYNDMVAKLGNLKDVMGDVQGRAKFFADDARWITAASSAVQGLVGAYAAYQGVVNLVGEENEDLRKSMMKIQSLMAIMMGLQQVAKTLNKDEAAMTAFRVIKSEALAFQLKMVAKAEVAKTIAMNTGTVAAKAQAVAWDGLSKAMKAAPFVAIAAAAAALAIAWAKSRDESQKYANTQKVIATVTATAAENIAKEKTELEFAVMVAKDHNRSLNERRGAIKRINDISPEYLGNITLENINTKEATAAIEGYIQKLGDKAKAEALMSVITEENAKIMRATAAMMGGLENTSFLDWVKAQTFAIGSHMDAYTLFIAQQGNAIDQAKTNIENLKKAAEDMDLSAMFDDKKVGGSGGKTIFKKSAEDTKDLGEAMTLAFTDVFPDDFDKRWDAWQKKLKETPAAIDEVVDDINGLAVSYSFLDKSMALLAENNKFGDWIDKNIDNLQKWADMASSVANSITSIMSDSYEKQSGEAEKAHTKEMDSLKKMLDQGIIDQASYDAQSAALEGKYLAEKEARDKKEFERRKALSIAEGTVKMALALINIWADSGSSTIEKLALSLVAAAGLAAQISNMRLASYAKGRDGGPSELAYVGERGYEYVETSTGRLYKTPDTATLTYLNAGDRVYTHSQSIELEKTLGVNNIPVLTGGKSGQNDYLSSKFDELISVYRNKKEVHMSVSRAGVAMMIKDGNRWTRHINDNVRL